MKINKIQMVEDTKGLQELRRIIRREKEQPKSKKVKKIKYKFNKRQVLTYLFNYANLFIESVPFEKQYQKDLEIMDGVKKLK